MFWFSTSPGFGKQKGSLQSCFSQLTGCKLSVSGNLIHSSRLRLKPRVLPPGPVAAGTPVEEEPDQKRWNRFLSQRKVHFLSSIQREVHFKSSIRSSGNIVAWLPGLKEKIEKERKKKKRKWIYFLLNSPTFCSLRIVPGQTRAFSSPFYPDLLLILAASPTVTHLFICFSICNFCPLQRAGLPVKKQ